MNSFDKLAVIIAVIALLTACSDEPSSSKVKSLIKIQYQQEDDIAANETTASADNDKGNKSFNNLIQSAMPILNNVDNINCIATKANNTYLCTADITQTMNGHTSTSEASFKIYKVNNKWRLDL